MEMRNQQTSRRVDEKRFLHIGQILFFSGLLVCSSAGLLKAQTITLSADACANAVAHTPAPDVSYTPGVDANGNAVVTADLPAATGTPQPPSTIIIPLQLDLKNALRLPSTSKYTSSDTNLGIIEYKDGKTTFNGQPIDAAAEAQIQAACAASRPVDEQTSGREKNILRGD